MLSHEYGLEKIKTIGDCYMAVGGIPDVDPKHLNRDLLTLRSKCWMKQIRSGLQMERSSQSVLGYMLDLYVLRRYWRNKNLFLTFGAT